MPDRHSRHDSTLDRGLIARTAAGDRRALGELSSADQEVLILRDIEGLHGPEAAKVLGIGERAVKSRLHRARLRLAMALRANAEATVADEDGGR